MPSRGSDPGEIPESFYEAVGERSDRASLSERERLAAEFAERYAEDHLHIDDALWGRLHAAFSDDELVDLGLCVASWLALGRFNQVFDIDGACRVPSPSARLSRHRGSRDGKGDLPPVGRGDTRGG